MGRTHSLRLNGEECTNVAASTGRRGNLVRRYSDDRAVSRFEREPAPNAARQFAREGRLTGACRSMS